MATRAASTLTGGRLVVAALAAHGVDTVFGIPGTHNLEVFGHLDRAGIRHVAVRHEQGAGFAADGWARVSGRPGVVLVTSGPGALNAATAAAQAWSDSSPVLIIAAGMERGHQTGTGGTGYLHEMPDQLGAMRAVVERAVRVGSHGELAVELARAFAVMTVGRPRPAYVEVPLDLLEASGEAAVVVASAPDPAPLDEPAVGSAASLLASAERPLVIAGGGARRAAALLTELAERLGAPVLTTANGKGVVDEDHPLSLGARLHLPAARALIERADVVLAVGTELAHSDHWDGLPELHGRLIRIDVDPRQADRNRPAELAVIADATDALRALLPLLDRDAGRPVQPIAAVRSELDAQTRAEAESWLGALAAIRGALARDAIVVGDSAMACYYGAQGGLPTFGPSSFLYPSGFGTLGFAVPAAIGAKLAAPGRQVVALSGDGGLMFTVAELATAAALSLPLPVVVFVNGGYGEIRREMRQRGDEPIGVDLDPPDFPLLARAMGAAGVAADTPDQLASELREALARRGPTLIQVAEPRR